MKRYCLVCILILALLSSCTFMGDKDVAVVAGQKITSGELYRYIPQEEFEQLGPEDKEKQINEMCDDYLAWLFLDENNIFDSGDIMWETHTWEVRELANGAYQNLIIDKILSEKAMLDLYEKMKYEINVSHILISYKDSRGKLNDRSREEARALVNDIVSKVTVDNFLDLAAAYSDDGSKEDNGGNIGWGTSGTWLEPFENAAYTLEPGSISQPVETAFGYHIIKLNARRETNIESYEKIKFDIMDIGMNRWRVKFAKREDAVYDSLNAKNQLVYNDSLLSDFSDRFTRLSKNVFYSQQFTAFDILNVFEDTLVLGYIGDQPINKDWLFRYLKLNSLQMPLRFEGKESVLGFIERNQMGDWLYRAAINLGLNKEQGFVQAKNVYMAQTAAPLFHKLYVFEQINPSSQELSDFYEDNKEQLYKLAERVSVREVLLKDSLEAVNILHRAQSRESVADLAAEYSVRNAGKKNRGLIPAVKKNQYGEMGIAVFNMTDGEIAGPFKIGEYYSVVERIELIPENYRSIKDVSYRLLTDYRKFQTPRKTKEQQDFLRNKYSVRINRSFIK